ncbi:MAG: putative addiction module antidote protein [Rhizobiales bacterium]|nr:putative addiction module antidote protein [Hyphomicrobiales bacterium]OJU34150.1 MAG: putative addiction module antidote protein [Rhizobiales bacterium 68-8]
MKIETTPFDPADYLKSDESQVELIADALESGDADYITNAIGIVARARGMTGVARGSGVTRAALYKALAPGGDPKLTTLIGVLKSLGLKLSAKAEHA